MLITTSSKNQLLDKKIEVETYNCEFLKNRIARIELQILEENSNASHSNFNRNRQSIRPSNGSLSDLKKELANKKKELPIKEAKLAKLLAEKNPPSPPPLPPPSFFEKYKNYIEAAVIGIFAIVVFLRKKISGVL